MNNSNTARLYFLNAHIENKTSSAVRHSFAVVMNIITWNCNMAFRKKAHVILTQKPDILVIPECEHPDKLIFKEETPRPNDILWFGNNRNKGLAIFSYSDLRLKVLDAHNENLKM